MLTTDGFDSNVEQLNEIVEEVLTPDDIRLSLVASDGRIFYDSVFPMDQHNGDYVFPSVELKDASINGSPSELSQLALENHMSRPEISAAFNNILNPIGAVRVSSTTPSISEKRAYVAHVFEFNTDTKETACVRISMLISSDST